MTKEDLILNVFLDFLNAVEAGIDTAKQRIKTAKIPESENPQKEPTKDPTHFDRLFWEEKNGQKGKYFQTSKRANNNCDLWREMKDWLSKNKGKAKIGNTFFWQFQNNPDIIGKKALKN